jgi:hypothetical protein
MLLKIGSRQRLMYNMDPEPQSRLVGSMSLEDINNSCSYVAYINGSTSFQPRNLILLAGPLSYYNVVGKDVAIVKLYINTHPSPCYTMRRTAYDAYSYLNIPAIVLLHMLHAGTSRFHWDPTPNSGVVVEYARPARPGMMGDKRSRRQGEVQAHDWMPRILAAPSPAVALMIT